MLSRRKILDELITRLDKELHKIEGAAKSAREYATQEDLKAEDQYDARAVEASYLASAEQKRVEEIKLDLQMLKEMELRECDQLEMGTLARIEFNGHEKLYFLTPNMGGEIVQMEGESILIISVFSPIGSAALNTRIGEPFEVETPKEVRTYTVVEIIN